MAGGGEVDNGTISQVTHRKTKHEIVLSPPHDVSLSQLQVKWGPPSQTEDFYQAIDSNRIRSWINSWASMQGKRVSGGGHAKTKCQIDGMAPVHK